jgi:hypothetical protein
MKISTIIRKTPKSLALSNLGGKSSFEIFNDGKCISIKNSKGTSLKLNQETLDAVWLRYQSLPKPKRYQAGQYVSPNWTHCPNTVFSPLRARVISYLA